MGVTSLPSEVRRRSELSLPFAHASDLCYVGDRIEGASISEVSYRYCTFEDVSFKKVVMSGCRFLHCVFLDCYFRRATLKNCSFVGCRFVECEFPYAKVQSCDFRYSRFRSCFVPYLELQDTLPREPNLRERLARNLCVEAEAQGAKSDARSFRLEAIRAREADLWGAVRAESSWYREHSSGFSRLRAVGDLLASKLNGFLWGYGEKWWVLASNFALSVLLIFPAVFWLIEDGLSGSHPGVGFTELIWYSISNVAPSSLTELSPVSAVAKIITAAEALAALVVAGLFASIFFRAIRR